ncbi:ferric reductase-like transmembrane domain-containing protein [Catenulispora subtropica]|uniref:Ferric oxidoreductase domain-containing protein n=1 Tax=Catenulispora subtropica TaxID=450798 RepID=A0ABP5ERL5_9ACTN
MTSAAVVTSTAPLWYATRATGVIALILLTASVVLGIVVQVRAASDRWPRLVTLGVHRNLSLLVLAFLALHIGTAVVDSYAPVGWLSLVVPFASSYRPLWLGLGTVAFDLLLAVTITSLLRRRISVRVWRAVHWAAYACWPAAVVHGLGTGSDPRQPVVLGLTIVCVAAVLGAGVWRLAVGWPDHARTRLVAAATGAVVVLAAGAWAVTGPLRPGWAARAGTPAALLARAQSATATANPAGPAVSSTIPSLPFRTPVSGTVSNSGSEEDAVSVTVTGTGADPVAFKIVIRGTAASGGGVAMDSSQVFFGPTAQPQRYTGQVTKLNGGTIQASVRDAAGEAVALDFDLSLSGTAMTGTLSAGAA